jgi:DNA repair protein RadC
VETAISIAVNTRGEIMGHYIIASGTLDTILVHPREVFRAAIVANAHRIILLHNHPSGNPIPSKNDIAVTLDLIRAGQILKIEVVDHIIMGRPTPARPKDYYSFREAGYFHE